MAQQKKYKIFYAVTDIGHLSKMDAKSLIEAMNYLYPNAFEYEINDVLYKGDTELGKKIGNRYKNKIAKYNLMYNLSFKYNDMRLKRFIKTEDGLRMINSTAEKIKEEHPDLIVSLSSLINSVLFEALKKINLDIPIAMVYNHNTIKSSVIKSIKKENNEFDRYIVISEHVKRDLIKKAKLDPSKVRMVDYPVKINFDVIPDEGKILEIKRHFDLPIDRRIALFYGSHNGYKNIVRIVKQIQKNDRLVKNGFFIIITRNNRKQYEELFNMVGDNFAFRVIGFSEQFYEYVAVSDILLSGANPQTLKQGLLLKKPVIITDYSDKEEKEHIDFILHKGYGKYEKKPHKIVEELEELILETNELKKIKANYEETNFKNGMFEIAKELIEIMNEYNTFDKKDKVAQRSAYLRKRNRS